MSFVAIERKASEPILPIGLFKMNVFSIASAISFVSGALMFGALTFIPVFLQMAKGASATQSGLQLIPMTFGILAASTVSGQYMSRTGRYRILPVIGLSFATLSLLSLTRLSPEMASWSLWLSLGGADGAGGADVSCSRARRSRVARLGRRPNSAGGRACPHPAIGDTISGALHPVYWIAAGLALCGLALALLMKEIPLRSREA
ncbi:MFS transporter [Celeribacter ethanolicus]|uniref:MFS transporter n=1 Tax=Celeribacter ethanolicus TaxID=1758178 RepID=UPI0024680119|nr:MFS transporter [Celeribacter ethanolicus]